MESNDMSIELSDLHTQPDSLNEQERDKEINGLLQNGFDSMSSISDGENLDFMDDLSDITSLSGDSIENDENYNVINLNNHEKNSKNDVTTSNIWNHNCVDFTSTPKQSNTQFSKRFRPKNSTIPEAEESEDNHMFGKDQELSNSICRLSITSKNGSKSKRKSLSPNKSPVKDLSISHHYVQLLLDNNAKLTDELKSTKQMLMISSQDLENLRKAHGELIATNENHTLRLVETEGRLVALDSRLSHEKEEHYKLTMRLEIAEATISSLREQLVESSKTNSIIHMRENNDALIQKLRTEHQNSLQTLREEKEKLQNELALANEKLTIGRSQNLGRSMESFKALEERNRKQEETITQNLRSEYEVCLKLKDEEIEKLENQVKELATDLERSKQKIIENGRTDAASHLAISLESYSTSGAGSPMTRNSDLIKSLKEEIERALESGRQKRNELKSLENQLLTANEELQEWKKKYENLKNDQCEKTVNMITLELHESEIEKMQNLIDSLEKQILDLQQLNYELEKAQQKPGQKEEIIETQKTPVYTVNGANVHNDSIKELVCNTMGLWKKESESNFTLQMNEQLRIMKINFMKELESEVRRLIDFLNKAVQIDDHGNINIKTNVNCLKNKYGVEMKLIFTPLKKLWLFLLEQLSEKQRLLQKEVLELNSAQQYLEASLSESRINPDVSINADQLAELRQELGSLRKLNEEMRLKLSKYQKHYLMLKKKHEKELVGLKQQCTEMLSMHEQTYTLKEQEIFKRFKLDSESLLDELNKKYKDLEQKVRKDLDDFTNNHGKIKLYEKILKILRNFHEFALDKIRQKDLLSENYADLSVSFMEPPKNISKKYLK